MGSNFSGCSSCCCHNCAFIWLLEWLWRWTIYALERWELFHSEIIERYANFNSKGKLSVVFKSFNSEYIKIFFPSFTRSSTLLSNDMQVTKFLYGDFGFRVYILVCDAYSRIWHILQFMICDRREVFTSQITVAYMDYSLRSCSRNWQHKRVGKQVRYLNANWDWFETWLTNIRELPFIEAAHYYISHQTCGRTTLILCYPAITIQRLTVSDEKCFVNSSVSGFSSPSGRCSRWCFWPVTQLT